MNLPPDDVDRITRELAASRGFQPVSVADNVPYEQYAAITVRLPELPGVAASRGFTRFYPGGSTVGQLVGYVGAASASEYERENKNPLLLIPGVKIGKEGLEKTLEPTLRGEPGGQRVEVTARGKLVKELDPKPDLSGGTVQLTIDSDLHEFAARRIGDQSCSVVVLDVTNGDILAMPSMPSFNPNNFSDGISKNEWKMLSGDDHLPLVDKALESLYPSGSTIKPSMAMALLNAGSTASSASIAPAPFSSAITFSTATSVTVRSIWTRPSSIAATFISIACASASARKSSRRWSARWALARNSICRSTTSATAPSPTPSG